MIGRVKHRFFPLVLFFALAIAGLVAARETIARGPAQEEAVAARASVAPTAEAEPAKPASQGGRTATLRKENDGHFWATAYVNGAPVRFIVDTGASVIALTPRDARKAGLDPAALPRSAVVSTANGKVKAGWTRLEEVRIEKIRVKGVDAVVIDEGLEHSLLGMSFLSQLDSWQVSPKTMSLKQ